MLWNIAVSIAMWLVGMGLFSLGISQIFACLFCAIPATKRFSKEMMVDTSYIYKKCAFTIILWLSISAGVIFAVMRFVGTYGKAGFIAGLGLTFLLSLGKFGMNEANMTDYLDVYGKAFAPKDLRRMRGVEPTPPPNKQELSKVDAYNLVSKYARKSGMTVLEYCRKCAEQEYLSEGVSPEQAKGRAEGRFQDPGAVSGFVEMAYELISYFSKKNNMSVSEYVETCERLERGDQNTQSESN